MILPKININVESVCNSTQSIKKNSRYWINTDSYRIITYSCKSIDIQLAKRE